MQELLVYEILPAQLILLLVLTVLDFRDKNTYQFQLKSRSWDLDWSLGKGRLVSEINSCFEKTNHSVVAAYDCIINFHESLDDEEDRAVARLVIEDATDQLIDDCLRQRGFYKRLCAEAMESVLVKALGDKLKKIIDNDEKYKKLKAGAKKKSR